MAFTGEFVYTCSQRDRKCVLPMVDDCKSIVGQVMFPSASDTMRPLADQ